MPVPQGESRCTGFRVEDRAPRDAAAPLGRLEGRDANVGSRRGREGPAHDHPRREAEGLVGAVRPTADRPLVVHSDGGAVYMGDDWALACEAGHVTRSMSRKARSPDNPRCEGFFGTLKSVLLRREGLGRRDVRGVLAQAGRLHRVVQEREGQEGAGVEVDQAAQGGARLYCVARRPEKRPGSQTLLSSFRANCSLEFLASMNAEFVVNPACVAAYCSG